MISPCFDPRSWFPINEFQFEDITLHKAVETGAVRIAFNRPDLRNAFRPQTVDEFIVALDWSQAQTNVGVVIITGNGPSSKDGVFSFSSGGDQTVRGKNGYEYNDSSKSKKTLGRLHILEVQRLIRFMPKVVIAVIPGWAVGGGHSLHVTCDLSIASEEHAQFMQTDPDVASFDGGFGSAYLARQVGQKRAREIFFLGQSYTAKEALDMGMVNKVVPHLDIEKEALLWAQKICSKSPMAIKMLKFSFNLIDDGLIGQQIFAGEATRLAYETDEAQEGRESYLEKRDKNFQQFPWRF
jgi:naphthoate synthase